MTGNSFPAVYLSRSGCGAEQINRSKSPGFKGNTHMMAFLTRLATGIFALLMADVSPAQAQLESHLYREQSRPEVYLVEGGRRIWIPTPDTLFAMGYGWGNVEVVPDGTLQPLPRFDIPSTSPTPGALYYPPDGTKLQVLRAVPEAVTIHSRGKEVQLVELQGWLRGVEVEPDCGDGWDIHDLDAQTRYWLLEMPDIPGLHQVIDRTGRDAVDGGFLDHCGECLLGHSRWALARPRSVNLTAP